MKKKKQIKDPVYAIEWGKLKITYRGLVTIICLTIMGIVLIVNVGYDKKQGGFYWKPADVKVDIKKEGRS